MCPKRMPAMSESVKKQQRTKCSTQRRELIIYCAHIKAKSLTFVCTKQTIGSGVALI